MFTGIIEETGVVEELWMDGASGTLTIRAEQVLEKTKVGDSIAVNGVCLTVCRIAGNTFTADVMAETMRRTGFACLTRGSGVNLERAMAADGRFGGHIVSGHIDGTGTICQMQRESNAVWVTVAAPGDILRYIVEKGSIAIDGISLTVAYVDEECFKVSVIPHTGGQTTLLGKAAGDVVNLECDIIAKYVEKLTGAGSRDSSGEAGVTMEFLIENGF